MNGRRQPSKKRWKSPHSAHFWPSAPIPGRRRAIATPAEPPVSACGRSPDSPSAPRARRCAHGSPHPRGGRHPGKPLRPVGHRAAALLHGEDPPERVAGLGPTRHQAREQRGIAVTPGRQVAVAVADGGPVCFFAHGVTRPLGIPHGFFFRFKIDHADRGQTHCNKIWLRGRIQCSSSTAFSSLSRGWKRSESERHGRARPVPPRPGGIIYYIWTEWDSTPFRPHVGPAITCETLTLAIIANKTIIKPSY